MQSSAMAVTTGTDEGLAAHVTAGKKFIVITGSSGVGKTTVVKAVREQDQNFRLLVSVTTRKQRESDLPGEYHYITGDQFRELDDQEAFEWQVPNGQNGNRYGTLKCSVVEARLADFPTVLHMEPATVPNLLRAVGEESVHLIFLTAPHEVVKNRLRQRDEGMPEEHFQQREATLTWEDEARLSDLPYVFVENRPGELQQTLVDVAQIITAP